MYRLVIDGERFPKFLEPWMALEFIKTLELKNGSRVVLISTLGEIHPLGWTRERGLYFKV